MQDATHGGNRPAPAPRLAPSFTQSINRAVQSVQHARPIAHAAPVRPARGQVGGSENQGAGGAGTARGDRFKSSPAYHHAIILTFDSQPLHAQQQILAHAQTHHSPEGNMILDHVNTVGLGGKQIHASLFPAANVGGQHADVFDRIGNALSYTLGHPSQGVSLGPNHGGLLGAATATANPISPKTVVGAGKMALHAGSDLLNLPKNTVEGGYALADQLLQGHFGNAFHMAADPFVQLALHPGQVSYEHPLNTLLMLAGPEAAVGRLGGAAARSGALGEKIAAGAETARAPLELGQGTGIFEHRSYSKNLLTKAVTVARERAKTRRGGDPNVQGPAHALIPDKIARTFTIGLDAKLARIAHEETAVHQIGQRETRTQAIMDMLQHRPADKHVANIMSHIVQGVIRTPHTAVEDIAKEINRLRAEQGKLPRGIALRHNRQQIRDLSEVLHSPQRLGQLSDAFEKARALQGRINSRDHYLAERRLIDPEQAMKAKLFPYAQAHMGAKYNHVARRLETADGAPLTTEAILSHMQEHGVPEPAYVAHHLDKTSARNFYASYRLSRGAAAGKVRTGEAFRRGAYDHSYNGLIGQAAQTEQIVQRASLHDRVVNRVGITKPASMRAPGENGYFNPDEGRKFAYAYQHDDHGNPIPGRPELVPMTAFNAKGNLHALGDIQHPSELKPTDELEHDALNRAIQDAKTRTDQTRNVVLVPKPAANAFLQQYKAGTEVGRAVGRVTQQFRRTVLPYSTHWMLQIGTEAALRGLVGGVFDPRNIRAGHQLMDHLTKTPEGRDALRQMVTSTFYNAHDPLARVNPNEGAVVGGLKRLPPTKQLIAAHNMFADHVGAAMHFMEREFRLMGLGKLARNDVREFSAAWQKASRLQGETMADLATRLKADPARVAAFGRAIDETFGKYNKFGPTVRAAVQTVSPFLPWYLNAARFVFWTLPVKHPVASALTASLRQTINQDIAEGKQLPLDKFAEAELARLTPFGIAGRTFADSVLTPWAPQFMGAYNIMRGLNTYGDKPLKGPHGDLKNPSGAEKGWIALNDLLGALVPATGLVKKAREGGGSPYDTSTIFRPQVKPGSKIGLLNRMLNPVHSLTSPTGGSGGSNTGLPFGGGGGSSSGSSGLPFG